MLPHAYQTSAAVVLVLGGALSCFAGYRLFRIVLGVYGFMLGALIGSSMMGVTNNIGMIVAAVLGGIVGAVSLMFAYLVGIALVGAGLGALVTHIVWSAISKVPDPPALAVIIAAVIGAAAALIVQRYVIIVATAFAGAWTMLLGAAALQGARTAVRPSASDAWILYPLTPVPSERWMVIGWVILGAVGTTVQLALTSKKK